MNTTSGPRQASASDRTDALVGMLLEHARIMHTMLGGLPSAFDFDATRTYLRRLAESTPGTNPRADRYRALARRGLRGRSSTGPSPTVEDAAAALLPCEQD